jgi:hypothetical protein
MRAVPAATIERMLKLVRMLSSDNPNEAGAAALALNRTLRDAGLDIHDLAGVVGQGFRVIRVIDADAPNVDDDWRGVVEWCTAQAHRLPEREREFLETLQGWRGAYPTDKQLRWLRDIAARLWRQRKRNGQ